MVDLSGLERAVIEALLSRDEHGYDMLRQQLKACRVLDRTMTGVGFYAALEVPPEASAAPADVGSPLGHGRDFRDDVHADIEGLRYGAGFVLWLADGRLEASRASPTTNPGRIRSTRSRCDLLRSVGEATVAYEAWAVDRSAARLHDRALALVRFTALGREDVRCRGCSSLFFSSRRIPSPTTTLWLNSRRPDRGTRGPRRRRRP